jgi:hypothetical protein
VQRRLAAAAQGADVLAAATRAGGRPATAAAKGSRWFVTAAADGLRRADDSGERLAAKAAADSLRRWLRKACGDDGG